MINKEDYILSKFPDEYPNSSGVIHACCPFHDDDRHSFSIDIEEGLFICGSISCGVRGNFPLFYKMMENIDSWKTVFEDLRQVTTNYDVNDLFEGTSRRSKNLSVTPFPDTSICEPIQSISYLSERGLGADVVQAFGLTYGKSGEAAGIGISKSIICPVWDIDGSYRTFQVRYLSKFSKMRWLNPPGSPVQDLLYGGWRVTPDNPYLWIVEGASDVWKLFTYGIQAVGLNTKEASSSQMNKILKLCSYFRVRPVVCLDADAYAFSEKLADELFACGVSPMLIKLEGKEDPGSLSFERLQEVWRV